MKIEVFSDIACPWCYIGEKRLMRALETQPELEAQVEWKPFQLQPGLPKEGLAWEGYMAEKFGGLERMQMAFERVAQAGAPDGIEFNFAKVARAINSVDGHRLILWAAQFEKQWELADALFKAHFSEGKNLNNPTDLLETVAAVGLDAQAAQAFLATDELENEVSESQDLAARFGVQGVPFFIFDRKYALSGAQPLEVFLQVLEQVQKEAIST